MNYQTVIQTLSDAVAEQLKKVMDTQGQYDRTYKCRVEKIKNSHSVIVSINGQMYDASTDIEYSVGDLVWVTVPRNNWNDIFVVRKTK